MFPILISPPDFIAHETEIVRELFTNGLERYHVRKLTKDINPIRLYLKQIPKEFHSRIIIHNHIELLTEFEEIGGFHFNHQNPYSLLITNQYKGKIFTQAIHNLSEINDLNTCISYAFLSPIYNSISKKEVKSQFTERELKDFFDVYTGNTKIVALGGIKPSTVAKTLALGFDNVAVLGYIWDEYRDNGNREELMQRWLSFSQL